MTVNYSGPIQRATTRTEGSVDINKLRVLIAEHLEVDVRHVTDDAHLSRDLGADWLDRLELIILVEEIAGVGITDDEADQIEVVGDLIHYIDKRRDWFRAPSFYQGAWFARKPLPVPLSPCLSPDLPPPPRVSTRPSLAKEPT